MYINEFCTLDISSTALIVLEDVKTAVAEDEALKRFICKTEKSSVGTITHVTIRLFYE